MGKKLKAAEQVKAKGEKSYAFTLSPALQGKYELRNTHCDKIHFDGQWHDFKTMDIETAERLVAKDDTHLYKLPEARS